MKQGVLSFPLTEDSLRKEIEMKDEQLMAYNHHCRTLEENILNLRALLEDSQKSSAENHVRLVEQMQSTARKGRSEARKNLSLAQFEIGYTITAPTISNELGETWVWGQKYKETIQQNKMYRHHIKRERKPGECIVGPAATTSSAAAAIRREDLIMKEKLEDLEREKTILLKEIRRITDEDRSRFNSIEIIANRYVMMSLLGKGGFSEVWKAYDVKTCSYVAIKFHQVASDWSEDRKRSYIRHSKRECEVHMTLDHPRVIQLYDVEILDDSTFASIMEYSEGCDLDTYLKRHGFLRESEARTILLQLIQGLRYLAEREERIIHYDMKPANILFSTDLYNCWDIKITDFGLCKIMTKDNTAAYTTPAEDTEIELTSQGTGTYWYLPPECFQAPLAPSGPSTYHQTSSVTKQGKEPHPARISTKVDVWALGVIFYQMLFGRKPFGEGLSQKQIWNNNIMGKIKEIGLEVKDKTEESGSKSHGSHVFFPSKPAVSVEAKEFIKSCLEVRTSERPDIFQLAKHPYVINHLQAWNSSKSDSLKSKRPSAINQGNQNGPPRNGLQKESSSSSSSLVQESLQESASKDAPEGVLRGRIHKKHENTASTIQIPQTEARRKSVKGALHDAQAQKTRAPVNYITRATSKVSSAPKKVQNLHDAQQNDSNISFEEYKQLLRTL